MTSLPGTGKSLNFFYSVLLPIVAAAATDVLFWFNPFLFIRGLSCLRCVQGLIFSKFYLDFLTTSFLYLVVTLALKEAWIKYWHGNQTTKWLYCPVGPPARCKLSCWVIWLQIVMAVWRSSLKVEVRQAAIRV